MYCKLSVIIGLLMLVSVSLSIESKDRLDIDILYESLCPDSLDFIKNQLYPIHNEIAEYVNIKFIPFGKSATFNNGDDVECQHGPKECIGNRIQSCVLSGLHDQKAQIEYVNCFMNVYRKDNMEFGAKCASELGINWNFIKKCYESNKGTQLQLAAEQETVAISPQFVPTILYNGIFDQRAQDDSLIDFRSVVCSFITQLYPNACKMTSALRI